MKDFCEIRSNFSNIRGPYVAVQLRIKGGRDLRPSSPSDQNVLDFMRSFGIACWCPLKLASPPPPQRTLDPPMLSIIMERVVAIDQLIKWPFCTFLSLPKSIPAYPIAYMNTNNLNQTSVRARSHYANFSDCDCNSSYRNKCVQDSMEVFTLCNYNNNNSYVAHYKQKQIAVAIRKKRTVWISLYSGGSSHFNPFMVQWRIYRP